MLDGGALNAGAPNGDAPDEGTPNGDAPDGDAPDASAPNGNTPDEGTPDEGTPDRAAPDEGTPDGDTPNGDTPKAGALNGTEVGWFVGGSDGGGRRVVDGSQILAQSIVAAGKALPGRTARSAHALFVSVADPERPLEFAVAPVHAGRSFASAVVTVAQGGRTRATCTVLLDRPQPDVIRHDRWTGPPVTGPAAACPARMPLQGRRLRIEGVADYGDPDEVGPPVLDAWLHYDTVPERDDLRRALLAHFTGHLSISATMRPHAGIGTAQAHHTVSTAVLGIGVTFHEPVGWDGWIRYHHESVYAGAGMCHVRGQVVTEDGRLLASFTQDAMIRAFDPAGTARSLGADARL
ncbi:acyl-CoA thioesterase [Actinomadura parmotrematis]|uniref:Thioesterase family protein n=1 Tax=Actinomadura parmotrematis TaxID=2864039 RepID=A0ABS7G0Y8_9ACTN|nr:acyl-CoA thioesterase domain-containing protein [Actinomadura parmotrematis]MBW8486381.1 thioesterase family protein [Actinomadura parmotrematis]